MRLPLKKKLPSLADLPAHIVTFRGHLARLTTAGQAPLALDAYRLFLASLSPFPVFHQYTLQSDSRPSRHMQPTFWASTPPTSSPTPTFDPSRAISKGTYEDGASENDGMGGDLIYPTSPPPSYPQYPTANAMQTYYPPHQPYPPQQCLPPPPGLGFNPYPYPMANGFYPYAYPPPAAAPAPAPAY